MTLLNRNDSFFMNQIEFDQIWWKQTKTSYRETKYQVIRIGMAIGVVKKKIRSDNAASRATPD